MFSEAFRYDPLNPIRMQEKRWTDASTGRAEDRADVYIAWGFITKRGIVWTEVVGWWRRLTHDTPTWRFKAASQLIRWSWRMKTCAIPNSVSTGKRETRLVKAVDLLFQIVKNIIETLFSGWFIRLLCRFHGNAIDLLEKVIHRSLIYGRKTLEYSCGAAFVAVVKSSLEWLINRWTSIPDVTHKEEDEARKQTHLDRRRRRRRRRRKGMRTGEKRGKLGMEFEACRSLLGSSGIIPSTIDFLACSFFRLCTYYWRICHFSSLSAIMQLLTIAYNDWIQISILSVFPVLRRTTWSEKAKGKTSRRRRTSSQFVLIIFFFFV